MSVVDELLMRAVPINITSEELRTYVPGIEWCLVVEYLSIAQRPFAVV